MAETKICPKCLHRKPADREHFQVDRRYRSGLAAQCRSCFNAYRRAWAKGRRRSAEPRVRLCKRCGARPIPPSNSGYRRRLCGTCLSKLRPRGDKEDVQVYADRLRTALGEVGLVTTVTGSIVRHNPFYLQERVELFLRLHVEVAFGDGVRSLDITDPLPLWAEADEQTLGLYVSTYARSVRLVLSSRQLTSAEVGAVQWDASRGDPGWADLAAAAIRGRSLLKTGRKQKAPEAPAGEGPVASGA